jgi:hypothetical protein
MMTDLERTTLADGFRVLLLGAHRDRASGRLAWRATLFDGRRAAQSLAHEGMAATLPPEQAAGLLALVTAVAAPPAVLAWHGNAARDLLARTVPAYVLRELRLLDLMATATALKPGLRPGNAVDTIARAYALTSSEAATLDAAVYEELLWAVVAEAGRRQETWPQLREAAQRRVAHADFGRYEFDEPQLRAVPPVPGVYLMYDRDDRLIYVGKSANLARRLNEYFRPTRDLTAKTATLRDRIRRFKIHPAGSELEALLIENAWIGRMTSGLNTQRRVAEGVSRYAFPLLPVAMVCPSTQAACVEVFVCGADLPARQVRLNTRRPGVALLRQLLEAAVWRRELGGKREKVTDWGSEGNELCCRYFARFKDRLTWLAVDLSGGTEAVIQSLQRAAEGCLRSADPAEFRLGD